MGSLRLLDLLDVSKRPRLVEHLALEAVQKEQVDLLQIVEHVLRQVLITSLTSGSIVQEAGASEQPCLELLRGPKGNTRGCTFELFVLYMLYLLYL